MLCFQVHLPNLHTGEENHVKFFAEASEKNKNIALGKEVENKEMRKTGCMPFRSAEEVLEKIFARYTG